MPAIWRSCSQGLHAWDSQTSLTWYRLRRSRGIPGLRADSYQRVGNAIARPIGPKRAYAHDHGRKLAGPIAIQPRSSPRWTNEICHVHEFVSDPAHGPCSLSACRGFSDARAGSGHRSRNPRQTNASANVGRLLQGIVGDRLARIAGRGAFHRGSGLGGDPRSTVGAKQPELVPRCAEGLSETARCPQFDRGPPQGGPVCVRQHHDRRVAGSRTFR